MEPFVTAITGTTPGANPPRRLWEWRVPIPARLLVRSYALMQGLWQLTAPTPARERPLERAELSAFRQDYLAQLEAALHALWRGTIDE